MLTLLIQGDRTVTTVTLGEVYIFFRIEFYTEMRQI